MRSSWICCSLLQDYLTFPSRCVKNGVPCPELGRRILLSAKAFIFILKILVVMLRCTLMNSNFFFSVVSLIGLKQWDNLVIELRVCLLSSLMPVWCTAKRPQGYDFASSKKWLSEDQCECNRLAVCETSQERPVCKHFGAVTSSPHLQQNWGPSISFVWISGRQLQCSTCHRSTVFHFCPFCPLNSGSRAWIVI